MMVKIAYLCIKSEVNYVDERRMVWTKEVVFNIPLTISFAYVS